ncbi:protein FAR1-RELATED SEQUENCE 5-like [Tripterygium wilfordii]|uniref:protein FAR1-RELATED SEQUENCE 5-like n=1 Tax=Tripterygium wilfordii TaxID=458696 RepID=UPI0018F82FF9|nr:protein FAR1-RELATED SEQUENCE 5-like [Tripterygium wilfordii]
MFQSQVINDDMWDPSTLDMTSARWRTEFAKPPCTVPFCIEFYGSHNSKAIVTEISTPSLRFRLRLLHFASISVFAISRFQSLLDWSKMDVSSSSSNDLSFIPQVRAEKVPKIGQEFESLEEAQKFYNEYAREAGFSIRMSTTNRNKSNEIIRKEFVCYKEGTREKGEFKSDGRRRRGTTREGCKGKMVVVRSTSKLSFIVSMFCEAHNHVLTTPRKVHLLRSHRTMSTAKKALTQQLSAANVPIHQQISILELEAGSLENIGCTEKDFYNARRDEVKLFAGHDAQMLYEYFEAEKEKNTEFYFSVDVDVENKITHCFWADAACRKAYQTFGDVVVFDTTYNTNRYGMIFAPFVGVNHHGQTTLFACAFLSDETSESFRWLLQQLLKAMPTGPPK